MRLLTPLIGCRTYGRSWLVLRASASKSGASVSFLYLLLATGVNSGCHAPKPGNCELGCTYGRDDQCINGMVCSDASLCVDPNWAGSCETSSIGGSSETGRVNGNAGGSGTAGGGAAGGAVSDNCTSGGQPETGAATGSGAPGSGGKPGPSTAVGSDVLGLGGETSAGSTSDAKSSGGFAGASTVGSGGTGIGATTETAGTAQGGAAGAVIGTIQITVAPPSPWCVGTEYNAVLTAGGGGPVFTWSAVGSVPGLFLDTSSRSTNSLTGTPTQAGNYEPLLKVTDEAGETGTLTLLINDRPTITTPKSLPDACQGKPYSVDLAATGGDASDLEWSATLPQDLGLTLSSIGTLSGVLQQAGAFLFVISVRNNATSCTSALRFELNVHDGT